MSEGQWRGSDQNFDSQWEYLIEPALAGMRYKVSAYYNGFKVDDSYAETIWGCKRAAKKMRRHARRADADAKRLSLKRVRF